MSKEIADNWLNSLPSQFRQEHLEVKQLSFYEVDSVAELNSLPNLCPGSVAVVRGENPAMYMRGTFEWVLQSDPVNPLEASDGN